VHKIQQTIPNDELTNQLFNQYKAVSTFETVAKRSFENVKDAASGKTDLATNQFMGALATGAEMMAKRWGGIKGSVGVQLFTGIVKNMTPSTTSIARAEALSRMAAAATAYPGRYARRVADLYSKSLAGSGAEFVRALGAFDAQLILEQKPMGRTTEELIDKLPQLLAVVRMEDENLADELLYVANQGDMDKLKEMASNLSRLPAAKGLVEQGIGWDGKVTSTEELNACKAQIMNLSNSPTERMRLMEELEIEGTCPVFSNQLPAEPVQRVIQQKRTKSGMKPVKM
jgi:hypothetical protein